MKRGKFQFEVTVGGDLASSQENVETLRQLWLDRELLSPSNLGPGNEGDFDNGAWHVSCHLCGAGGVMRDTTGGLLWLEISHYPEPDEYYASVTREKSGRAETVPIDSEAGREALQGAVLLGYVEGNSTGHTSARNMQDPVTLFNRWRRQSFDQPIESSRNGGKVWEHWCTLRDIRPPARIGISVLKAYLALCSALGDRFAPTVARGRRDYSHPKQLVALVRSGFTTEQSACWNTTPHAISPEAERLFLEAEPAKSLAAAKLLAWSDPPKYFMFKRRIEHWSSAQKVSQDLV
ncbi:MAG TPA: hypothetical protein VNZ03_02595 [Terriglobales bacterium]|jgi:hypothetical protein|nr:hypothetical protein [Terriglobales bacterium]